MQVPEFVVEGDINEESNLLFGLEDLLDEIPTSNMLIYEPPSFERRKYISNNQSKEQILKNINQNGLIQKVIKFEPSFQNATLDTTKGNVSFLDKTSNDFDATILGPHEDDAAACFDLPMVNSQL